MGGPKVLGGAYEPQWCHDTVKETRFIASEDHDWLV